ncbi:MAG: septal ring lytic transglycosylase RlpA family protein [Candidatus Cloacimonetes bacterium]|nr:septal ring lytic transglycosylase RlpA family protein [Candidatus Cloacimonadota bacterium]
MYMVCSYYGSDFHGKQTSNGEIFDMYKLTCAHKTLPFNTILKVTNEDNGQSVTVRVNDRGPFIYGRDLDLSYEAARQVGLIADGVKKMKIQILE